MRVYKVIWRSMVCLLAVAGVVLALSSLRWGPLVGLGVLGIVLGPLFGADLHWQARGAAAPLRHLLAAAAVAVVGGIAMAGFLAFLDAAALLVVGLLILSCPGVLHILLRRAPQKPSSPTDAAVPPSPSAAASSQAAPPTQRTPSTPVPAPPPLPCHGLTDTELCWRWRTTFTALQRSASAVERLRLIETRAALLDEIARRNPVGFSRWLNEGARAASDPARYFRGTHANPSLRRHESDH